MYSDEEIKQIGKDIIGLPEKTKTVHVYFNNHPSAKAAANALMLKKELGQKISSDYTPEFLEKYPFI